MCIRDRTVGDPVPVRGILRDGTPDMEKALGALLQSSPVEVVATPEIFGEAEYQPEENRIAIQPDLSGAASFRALAREIVYAQIGTGTVSYTHLDVYKRQASRLSGPCLRQ